MDAEAIERNQGAVSARLAGHTERMAVRRQRVQAYCITEYDLYRDFTDEYWDEKDEFDE